MIEKPKNGVSHPKNDIKKNMPPKIFFNKLFFSPNYINIMIKKPKNGVSHPKNDLSKYIPPIIEFFFLSNYISKFIKKAKNGVSYPNNGLSKKLTTPKFFLKGFFCQKLDNQFFFVKKIAPSPNLFLNIFFRRKNSPPPYFLKIYYFS